MEPVAFLQPMLPRHLLSVNERVNCGRVLSDGFAVQLL